MNVNKFSRGGASQLLQEINNGGTHEEHEMRGDENQGVPISMDEYGNTNSLEEGETVYNQNPEGGESMVFSNRIIADKENLVEANLPAKYAGMSYSEISKKMKQNADMRVNDRISLNTLNVNLERLAMAQESQKAENEFNSMSQKQKIDAMQRLRESAEQEQAQEAQQAQMRQQQMSPEEMAMQEQMMAQQGYNNPQMQGQPSPEEMAMMQQQGQPMMQAYGGRINRYAGGGFVDKLLNWVERQRANDINKVVDDDGNVHYVDGDGNVLQGGASAYNSHQMAMRGQRNMDIANMIGYASFLDKLRKGIDYSNNEIFERKAMQERDASLMRNDQIPYMYTKDYVENPELIRNNDDANYRMLMNNIYNSSVNPATATAIAMATRNAALANRERAAEEARKRNRENVLTTNNMNLEVARNNIANALGAGKENSETRQAFFRDTTPSFNDRNDKQAGYNRSIDSALQGFMNNRSNIAKSLMNIAAYNSTNPNFYMNRYGEMLKPPADTEEMAENGIGTRNPNTEQSREKRQNR